MTKLDKLLALGLSRAEAIETLRPAVEQIVREALGVTTTTATPAAAARPPIDYDRGTAGSRRALKRVVDRWVDTEMGEWSANDVREKLGLPEDYTRNVAQFLRFNPYIVRYRVGDPVHGRTVYRKATGRLGRAA